MDPDLFPELLPHPDPVGALADEWETELMRQHTSLAAMVGVGGNDVRQHGRACGSRFRPPVPAKGLDAVGAPHHSFRKHSTTARGASGEGSPRLFLPTPGAVERGRQLQMRTESLNHLRRTL